MSKQLCAVKKRLQSTYAGTSWWWYYCGSSSFKALILTWILLCSEFRIVLQKQKKLFWSTLVSIDHPSKYTDCVLPIIDQSVSIESIISTILSRLSSPASAPYLSSTPDCLHQHHTLIQQVGLVQCWEGIFCVCNCIQLLFHFGWVLKLGGCSQWEISYQTLHLNGPTASTACKFSSLSGSW